MATFTIDERDFLLDDEPFRILAGAMHYWRVLPEQWEDRMAKMRLMGLNALETYVAWNLHEPKPGEFDFSGGLDLPRYVELAARHGLKVIVRPGPYICSEWEFGGLPAWLLKDGNMRVRCCYQPYLDAVERFFDALLPPLVGLQISRGGPIIAMQVENEYGSYGNDGEYLKHVEDGMLARGIDCLLFTSDGATDWMLQGGTLPHVLKTANFGSRAEGQFAKLREYQPEGPLMCMEFWNGWFDHWGEEHHTRAPEDAAQALDEILSAGASVNFYMFHGGTNFGFMSGANAREGYEPTVTSYDYDSALDECGDITPKFLAFREVMRQHVTVPDARLPEPCPKATYGAVALPESAALMDSLDVLSAPVRCATPVPMEQVDQNYGFILYRTRVTGPRGAMPLILRELHDRALVFVDGEHRATVYRNDAGKAMDLAVPPEGLTLEILVENMGRINYGPDLHDRKGITDCVMHGQQLLFGWDVFPLPLDDLSGLRFAAVATAGPAFRRGTFDVGEAKDTFLAMDGWTKGVVWINGFNLGRYWDIGPTKTLYVPAPLLCEGQNELVVLELHGTSTGVVEFRNTPSL